MYEFDEGDITSEDDFLEGLDSMHEQLAQDEEWARFTYERRMNWWEGS